MELAIEIIKRQISQRELANIQINLNKEEIDLEIKSLIKVLEKITNSNYCDCKERKHIHLPDQFPYGDTIDYDECVECGNKFNFHVK